MGIRSIEINVGILGDVQVAAHMAQVAQVTALARPEERTTVEARLAAAGVPWKWLGTVGGQALVIGDALDVPVSALEETWTQMLPNIMGS